MAPCAARCASTATRCRRVPDPLALARAARQTELSRRAVLALVSAVAAVATTLVALAQAAAQPVAPASPLAVLAVVLLNESGGASGFRIDLSVRLTRRPHGDVPITVAAGASSVVVEIPDGVEAQVLMTGALTSPRSGNARCSAVATAGYPSVTDRVSVRITGGASSLTIR